MTTERAGNTAHAYPCRWGCGNGQSWQINRNKHERKHHGAAYTGVLAAEADRFRAERDALRTALAGLVEVAKNHDGRGSVRGALDAAIAAAEAALKGGAK